MRAFRIEHKKTKRGPYSSDEGWEAMQNGMGSGVSEKHPCPYDDSKLMKSGAFHTGFNYQSNRFCFSSLKQLRNWFYCDKTLRLLYNAGFCVNMYNVQKLYKGHTQCIFSCREHKDPVKEIDLLTLIEK